MTRLSVNVNKIALIRNSRAKNNPDLGRVARDILGYGAHGLTVHPRPDGRHVKLSDLPALSHLVRDWNRIHTPVEFNVEGYPSVEFLQNMSTIRPHQCTLVPDPPEALTSNAGWRVAEQFEVLQAAMANLKGEGVRISLFVEPATLRAEDWMALAQLKPDRVELYTEAFAEAFGSEREAVVVKTYQEAAEKAYNLGIGINAGHDLNLKNLATLVEALPSLEEVSIGHALICESLYMGLESTIQSYLGILSR